MRPRAALGSVPDGLKHLEGSPLLAEEALDPVCWDTFDADAIWAQASSASRERRATNNHAHAHTHNPHIPASSKTTNLHPPNTQTLRPLIPDSSRRTTSNINTNINTNPNDVNGNTNNVGGNRSDGGTWRRGVALPPASEENSRGGGRRYEDAENPEDLWDDPDGITSAAADFSAFGGSLDEQPCVSGVGSSGGGSSAGKRSRNGSMGSEGFELGNMSEDARKFEEDIHGTNGVGGGGDDAVLANTANPVRPLAVPGTAIRSGSGDDVNVFEDFGAPEAQETRTAVPAAVKGGDELSTASSRLMHMIGVTAQSTGGELDAKIASDISTGTEEDKESSSGVEPGVPTTSSSIFSFSSSVPRNPWGDPVMAAAATSAEKSNEPSDASAGGGLDLAARLNEVALEQTNTDQQQQQQRHQQQKQQQTAAEQEQEQQQRLQREEVEANNNRRRQEEEERRLAILVQQQAKQAQQQQAAAQQAAQQQQPPPQPAPPQQHQLEVILIERISTILENNWGRSDLVPVLQTLHNEDSRVIPLLGSVDALRALIARHPRRIALAKDPAFGAEIAVLGVTNAVWQQQQQQQQAAEDLRRIQQQQEQQKMIAAQQQEAAAARAKAESRAREVASESIVVTNDPWFYADPQSNVQGPFGGEEMRQWLEAGYFKGDLPISQNPEGSFRPLSSLFPDLTIAFKPAAPSEVEQARITTEAEVMMEAKAQADAIQELAEKAEAEKAEIEKAKADAKETAEKDRIAKEASVVVEIKAQEVESMIDDTQQNIQTVGHHNAVTNKKQSDQLKMLLGLDRSAENDNPTDIISHKGVVVSGPPPFRGKEIQQVVKPVPKTITDPQPQTNPAKTKPSKKVATVVSPQPEKGSLSIPTPIPAPTPAWGGAGAGKISGRKKSMSEIQREEAKIAAEVAKQRGALTQTNPIVGGSSGGWANIAASGGTSAWSGNTVIPSPVPVSTSISALPSAGSAGAGFQQARSRQQIAANTVQQQALNRSSTQKTMDEFGVNGKMSPMLESWCKEQMKKLNGTDDMTLVAFCMTLSDPIEIKQYITAYLGSTPQVNNFASEFINRKSGNPRQEQWETTAKKGRKKKGTLPGNYK